MNAERQFIAEVAGISTEVVKPQSLAFAGVGIGTSAFIDVTSGEPLLAITIRHADGAVLTALLDDSKIHRLADMMACFVEALPALASEARH